MDTGIQVQKIWWDEDVTEILVSAWNGTFGGVTRIYVGIGGLKEAAERLSGFPNSPTDIREVTFGQFDLGPARVGQFEVDRFASGISMRFHCVNGAGDAYLDARLQSDNRAGTSLQLLRLEAIDAGAAH